MKRHIKYEKPERARKFYIVAIEEGKYWVRVDGFSLFYSTDEGEARRMVHALNDAFADVIDETRSMKRHQRSNEKEIEDLLG